MTEVALRHEISSGLLYARRKQALAGLLEGFIPVRGIWSRHSEGDVSELKKRGPPVEPTRGPSANAETSACCALVIVARLESMLGSYL
jgi:hypothetical protein